MAYFHDITLDGRRCILVLPDIDWRRRPRIIHSFSTSTAEAKTGIEGTAAQHDSMRVALDYHFTFEPADGLAFDELLDALNSGDQDWRLLLPDPGDYSIDAGAGHSHSVGLVMCSLIDPPTISAEDYSEIDLKAEEDAPYAARIAINTLTQEAWDFEPDWSVRLPADSRKWQRKRDAIGLGRELSLSGEDAPLKKGQSAGFTFTSREEIRQVLTFFSAKAGGATPFSVARWYRPVVGDGPAPSFQARFSSDILTLEFISGACAKTELTFIEQLVLTEGEPDQQRPKLAALYTVWWEGSSTINRWTDWEAPIVVTDVGTYATNKIEHKAPTENLEPGTSEWEVMVRDFEGNPFRAFTLIALERRLRIQIHERNPDDADATRIMRFDGEVATAPSVDKVYTAKCVLLGGRLNRYAPNFYNQPACNYTIYGPGCDVPKADFKETGTVADIDSTTIDIACADDSSEDDYYANGFASFGTGDDAELRYILHSEAITGGQRLTIHRPLRAIEVGDDVEFYPGCDGQFFTGCAKFDNQGNHGGAPWQPAYIAQVASGFSLKTGK